MWLIDKLAEQRIKEASERGEFDNLPGSGRPLVLDDDSLVPEELRAGFRLLKNAGYLPQELQLRKDIAEVEALLRLATSTEERSRAERRLQLLQARLGGCRGDRIDLSREQAYRDRILNALNPDDGGGGK